MNVNNIAFPQLLRIIMKVYNEIGQLIYLGEPNTPIFNGLKVKALQTIEQLLITTIAKFLTFLFKSNLLQSDTLYGVNDQMQSIQPLFFI